MSLKRGNSGEAVTQLQNDLLELGEHLPRWGADGKLGDETFDAVTSLLVKHGRKAELDPAPDVVDDEELKFIGALRDLLRESPKVAPPDALLDRRAQAGGNKDMGPRSWPDVKGWCLHQTACHLGASKDPARCDNIGAHFVVYQDGRVFWLHDLDRRIIHGNGFNSQTIGIEIDGLFAGVEGDLSTVWDDQSTPQREQAMTLTPAQTTAVKQLIRWTHAEIVRHGGQPTTIVAHRQASGDRRDDPGSKVWKEIAMPMLTEFRLSDGGPGFMLKDGQGGMPIPESWDPSRTGIKY
jgi:N-acetylmuramoyl-L-alanine amidase